MFSCLLVSLSVVSRSWALVAPSSPSWASEDVRSMSAPTSRSSTAAGGELAPFILDFDVKRSVSGIPAIDRDDVVVRFFSRIESACELNVMGFVQYLANVTVSGQRASNILTSLPSLHSCILIFPWTVDRNSVLGTARHGFGGFLDTYARRCTGIEANGTAREDQVWDRMGVRKYRVCTVHGGRFPGSKSR